MVEWNKAKRMHTEYVNGVTLIQVARTRMMPISLFTVLHIIRDLLTSEQPPRRILIAFNPMDLTLPPTCPDLGLYGNYSWSNASLPSTP